MGKQPRRNYPFGHLVADLAFTGLALLLSDIIRPLLPFGRTLDPEYAGLSPAIYLMAAVIWMVVFLLFSVYAPRPRRALDETQFIFVAVTFATLVLAGMLYFTFRGISRLQILIFYIADLVLLIGYRLILRLVYRTSPRTRQARRRVLILGAGETGRDALDMMVKQDWAGLEPVGFLDNSLAPGTSVGGYPVLGPIKDVEDYVESEGVDEIVVALPLTTYDQFFPLMADLRDLPARVRLVPDHLKLALFRTAAEDFAGVPMITMRQPTLNAFERHVKRAFDLVLGTIGLLIALPFMALTAVAIRLDSRGPVVYRQPRVAENGEPFQMYKFRSMIEGADEMLEQQIYFTEHGELLFKQRDDPRITHVGRFLRRFSLDELPQFVNVLKGEMSLVGPRPELPWIVERYEPWQWQRLSVPQGMTGWWQVNGRSDKPMHLHTEEDLYYIQNYSLLLDLQILWSTIGAVLRGRGAF
jgi:exopolysaccharide biosynthesis polyprenyl glycosylphosphotransferase